MIIGFGSTEKLYEEEYNNFFQETCSNVVSKDADYVSDNDVALIRDIIKEYDKETQLECDAYKGHKPPDCPDRYSRQWSTIIADASHIVLYVRYLHINRQHGLSPDGWGALSKEGLYIWKLLDHRQA